MHNFPLFIRTNSTCTLSERPSQPCACQAQRPGGAAGGKDGRGGGRGGGEGLGLQTQWFPRQDPTIPMSCLVRRNEPWLFHSLPLMKAKNKEMETRCCILVGQTDGADPLARGRSRQARCLQTRSLASFATVRPRRLAPRPFGCRSHGCWLQMGSFRRCPSPGAKLHPEPVGIAPGFIGPSRPEGGLCQRSCRQVPVREPLARAAGSCPPVWGRKGLGRVWRNWGFSVVIQKPSPFSSPVALCKEQEMCVCVPGK